MDLDFWDCFGRKKIPSFNRRNTVDPDEVAHYEPPHLETCSVLISLEFWYNLKETFFYIYILLHKFCNHIFDTLKAEDKYFQVFALGTGYTRNIHIRHVLITPFKKKIAILINYNLFEYLIM